MKLARSISEEILLIYANHVKICEVWKTQEQNFSALAFLQERVFAASHLETA